MKFGFSSALVIAAAAVAFAGSAAGAPEPWQSPPFSFLPRSLQRDPHVQVLIVTERTPIGRTVPQPTPQHPMYYRAFDGGIAFMGDPRGGEIPPPRAQLDALMVKSLAVNGYLQATKAHPPNIIVLYRYGSLNNLKWMGPDDAEAYANVMARAIMVGGHDFAQRLNFAMEAGTVGWLENDGSVKDNYLVHTALHSNLYFIVAAAYGLSWHGNTPKLLQLWHTTISTDARGVTMAESLPAMAKAAGPYLGRETKGPARIDLPIMKPGTVTIGPPVLVEWMPGAPLPSIQ